MADFTNIKSTINAQVKQNGVQAITGNILNGVLNGIVDAVNDKKSDPVTISQNTQTGGVNIKVGGVALENGNVASQSDMNNLTGATSRLTAVGRGTTWAGVTFNTDGSHEYYLKLEGITDASDVGTGFFQIITTIGGSRTQRYVGNHGAAIADYYYIPLNCTKIEVLARYHTTETMVATLSSEYRIGRLEDSITTQFPFIVGSIYLGVLSTSSVDCLSHEGYIPVMPSRKIHFLLGDSLKVRITEYDDTRTYITSQGYDVFTSLVTRANTRYIRVSLIYSNRGYGASSPIVPTAYKDGDFVWYESVQAGIEEQAGNIEHIKVTIGAKQDIINGSRNLYDASKAENGYLDQNGAFHAGDVKLSDYIFCYGKQKITTNYGGRSGFYLCFYDANKNFVRSVPQYLVYTFDVPSGAVFFRISMSAYSDTNMIVFGGTIGEYEPYKGVDYIFGHLVEDRETITDINADKAVALSALKNATPNTYALANKNIFPLFSIATDIHSDWDRLKRMMKYCEDVGVNSMFCLGDIGDQQASFDSFDWQNFVLGSAIPILAIPGNHEFVYNAGQSVYTGYTDETLAAKMYNAALVSHNGEIHPSGKNYWYKDISYSVRGTAKKLRIIGIYQYEFVDEWEGGHPVHTQNTTGKDMPYYKQAQIDWLVGLLDSADANTDVMILMHHAPTNNLERVDNTWNPAQNLGISIISGVSNNTNNDFIPQIIDAWINGTSVNKSSTMGNDNSVISVNHTFASSHHGKFIGYITGHSHYDAITKIAGMDEQYVYTNVCTSAADGQQGSDLPRDTSGKIQDCFNIIAYDCLKHRVGIVKIGSDVSVDMRDKKYACNFNYIE